MHIAVIQDDEFENEYEMVMCCSACAKETYSWSEQQYEFVKKHIEERKPISIPYSIKTVQQFVEFIKNKKI